MGWLPFRRGSESQLGGGSNRRMETMSKELEQLRMMTSQLQGELRAAGVSTGEYLYRYQPYLGAEWELQYVVLAGTTIKVYKSPKDMVYNPTEEISVMGCYLEWEGLRQGRHWALSIIEPGGSVILRLSALSGGVALKWVDAFAEVGCIQIGNSSNTSSSCGSEGGESNGSLKGLVLRRNSFEGLPNKGSPRMKKDNFQAKVATPERRGRASLQLFQHEKSGKQAVASAVAADTHATSATKKRKSKKSSSGGAAVGKTVSEPPLATVATEEKDTQAKSPQAAPKRTNLPMMGSSPVHTAPRSSYLSSDRIWHEKHTGLYNLSAVVLVAANFRLALENMLKYGWRYNPVKILSRLTVGNPNFLLAACYPALLVNLFVSLGTEVLAYKLLQREQQVKSSLGKRSDGAMSNRDIQGLMNMRSAHEWLIFIISFLNTGAALLLPCYIIHHTNAEPVSGIIILMLACVCWMKLVSYHHCCWDLRQARREGSTAGDAIPQVPSTEAMRPGERGSPATPAEWALLRYPENLTVANLAYFVAAPTLVYQINYPRSPKIRVKWILRRIVELVFVLTFMSFITHQFVEPTIYSAIKPLKEMNWLHVVERVLKLALPSTYVWLCGFYCLFHLWLNILAELTHFADREFYKDWWNASTVGEYWRLWNMPVHKWLLRHVYFPAVRVGLSRHAAVILVFFVSALFHELILGVPLHLVRFWVFAGMMAQVPLAQFTDYLRTKMKRDDLGNILFWVSFCVVGQPVCVLLYTHDFLLTSGQQIPAS